METSARIVVIGGGVIGLSVAYHLAELGITDVLLAERNTLTSGTSWHAAGIVGPLRATLNLTLLAREALDLFPRLEAQTGQGTGFRTTGGVWLARCAERLTELRRIADLAGPAGLHAYMLSAPEIAARVPGMSVEGIVGGLWVNEDAQASPVDLCMAYARQARARGVRVLEGSACVGVERRAGRVVGVRLSGGVTVRCEAVVNCAGAWARDVGMLAEVPVPLQAAEHMYVVTEPLQGVSAGFPVLRDLDRGIYIKGDAGRLVLGGFEPDAKPFDTRASGADTPFLELPEDWEQFEPFMHAGLALYPGLRRAGIRTFMNGPESFTPDTLPLLGESPYLRGFFVAAGFNSTGMMSSAGAGRAVANWVAHGDPGLDLWALDIARFDRHAGARRFVTARIDEAVADLFRMHWPFKQPVSGRGTRRTVLHDSLARAGAEFGAMAGWERPLWFATDDSERASAPGWEAQPWWTYAGREAKALAAGVGLFDLSPFTKIDVSGKHALTLLQYLCAADVDIAPGRCVYTQMLNERGGIEADVTLVRVDDSHFRLFSGAPTRRKDRAWLRRHADDLGLVVQVEDRSSAEAVLAVMGPAASRLLQTISDADLSLEGFPYYASRLVDVGSVVVRATRLSFAGEAGFELSVPVECAMALFEALSAAGEPFGLVHCGLRALEACRLEKAYRHWGHDIGPRDTPIEAGLDFAVGWSKSHFLGRDALMVQRTEGVRRRLLQFAVEGPPLLLLHDEPIARDGQFAGFTTSGGQGFRTGLQLCFGYVECAPGESADDMARSAFTLTVAGEQRALTLLPRAPYDPDALRMRQEPV